MSSSSVSNSLHSLRVAPVVFFNRAFAVIYSVAILALLCRHLSVLLYSVSTSSSFLSFLLHICLLVSDVILAFMWSTTQSYRMRPVVRQVFPENLGEKDFPAMDIFICTADPYKEPPMDVVNTALSVMAFDYPTEKLSVYVSDDGGSDLTLFAFMEGAKFGKHWLPFCRENRVVERCPDAFFSSNYSASPETENIKRTYQDMKMKVESVVERGKVIEEFTTDEDDREAFSRWNAGFTRQDHPAVIQVLLGTGKDEDVLGHPMPNLIYVSRGKSKTSPHHFKAGALNALLRVSGTMTNAPVVLTLDCDMYSNDPQTPKRALCYLMDKSLGPDFGYVQFPQRFHGLNRTDIYASEHKRLFLINPPGMDGLSGPSYVGSGCFFNRRVFFGGPFSYVQPEIPELSPDYIVNSSINARKLLDQAHCVAGCDYENRTQWGFKMGFSYGSLVEDYYTGYRLQCEGWKSAFCSPERPAFLGDVPVSLNDVLNQTKRWSIGLLEVAFSRYSPLTYGVRKMGFLMAHTYTHYAFWPIWSIPVTVYAFIPQLALLNGNSIFPKISDPWSMLYGFLFLGAYGQDCLDFMREKGTLERWWNDQRMWLIRGLSSFLFGTLEYFTQHLGMFKHGFNVTSKVVDDEQSKRYEQGMFEFGVHSPMFVPLATAAILNLIAFLGGIIMGLFGQSRMDGLFLQMLLAGFGTLNCWPVYEAMVLRTDKGRMATKTTIVSSLFAWSLYAFGCWNYL